MLKQLTVFLENRPGRMEEVTAVLASGGINIHALSIADTTDFGILRMIVSAPDKAVTILKENGFMVKTNGVIAIPMGHSPGSLHRILLELKNLDISIEYMYAFTSRHKDYDAIVIFSIGNQEAALAKLKSSGFPVLDDDFLDQLNEA